MRRTKRGEEKRKKAINLWVTKKQIQINKKQGCIEPMKDSASDGVKSISVGDSIYRLLRDWDREREGKRERVTYFSIRWIPAQSDDTREDIVFFFSFIPLALSSPVLATTPRLPRDLMRWLEVMDIYLAHQSEYTWCFNQWSGMNRW